MYGIFTYIYQKNRLNVGEYTIHGWYGVLFLFVAFFGKSRESHAYAYESIKSI